MKARLTIAVVVMFGVLVWTINSLVFPHPSIYMIQNFEYLVQPNDITCGPTSVTMLLRRYGIKVSIDEVEAKTKTQWFWYDGQAVGMTSPEYIPIALKFFGVRATLKRGYLDRLKYYVAQDKPCVVLLRSGDYLWHYVVVIGYDKQSVFVADPGSGQCEQINNQAFEGAWGFTTDMRGEPVKSEWLTDVLRSAEVYPNSMVVPRIHIDSP